MVSTIPMHRDQRARPSVLVVEDDADLRATLSRALRGRGYRVASAGDGSAAMRTVRRRAPDLILLDMNLPDTDGLEVMREAKSFDPGIAAVLVTGYGTVERAVHAMRQGAHDFLVKPVRPSRLFEVVDRVLVQTGGGADALVHPDPALMGESRAARRLRAGLRQAVLAPAAAVLIRGESGVGKTRIARVLHESAGSRAASFTVISCAPTPDGSGATRVDGVLLEPTGAAATRGGTLVLEHVELLPAAQQQRLARALETDRAREADDGVTRRVVATTECDPDQAVRDGLLSADLRAALGVHALEVPPLRERPEDIPILAAHFLHQLLVGLRRSLLGFSSEAIAVFAAHAWPGNIRELRNVVEHAVLDCDGGEIGVAHLGPLARHGPVEPRPGCRTLALTSLRLRDMEQALVRLVLQEMDGNISAAARELGINRSTLYVKIREYGLDHAEV